MKSKAYCFANAADYDIDDISKEITFAETAGKAKQDFSMENGIHYKDIRVQRLPWADKYGNFDSIPAEELLNPVGLLIAIPAAQRQKMQQTSMSTVKGTVARNVLMSGQKVEQKTVTG